jgi:hypothetical protein
LSSDQADQMNSWLGKQVVLPADNYDQQQMSLLTV